MLKLGILFLVLLLGALQYKAWFSDVGHVAAADLREQIAAQQLRASELAVRNDALVAEVLALKTNSDAIESRARADLGMVKNGEQYYLVAPQAPQARQ